MCIGVQVEELESMRRADEARLKAVLKESDDLKKEQFKRSQRCVEIEAGVMRLMWQCVCTVSVRATGRA